MFFCGLFNEWMTPYLFCFSMTRRLHSAFQRHDPHHQLRSPYSFGVNLLGHNPAVEWQAVILYLFHNLWPFQWMDDTISLLLFNDTTSTFCFSITRSSSSTSVTLFLWSQPSGPQSRCRMTSCPTFFHNEPFHVLLWSLACVKIYFSICEAPCLLRTVDLPLHCTSCRELGVYEGVWTCRCLQGYATVRCGVVCMWYCM